MCYNYYKGVDKMHKNKRGFTLVEVIVVLVILAILAAVLIPSLIGYIEKSKVAELEMEANQFKTAFQTALSETYGTTKQYNIIHTDSKLNKKTGKISSNSLGRIKYKKGFGSDWSNADVELAKAAYKLIDGDLYEYNWNNNFNSGVKVLDDDKLTIVITYDVNWKIIRTEVGHNGYLVTIENGKTTTQKNGTFVKYN